MKIMQTMVRVGDTADLNRLSRGLPSFDRKRMKRVKNKALAMKRARNKGKDLPWD